MFHTCAFSGSFTLAGGLANASLVADSYLTPTSAGQAIMPVNMKLKAAMGQGATVNRMVIRAPSQRKVIEPDILPLEVSATISDIPNINRFVDNHTPQLLAGEGVIPQLSITAAGPETDNAFLWLEPVYEEPGIGSQYCFRFTGAIAGVANAWASGAMTPVDVIPTGTYDVIGMFAFGTNLGIARLIPQANIGRPGVIAANTLGSNPWDWWRAGRFGKFMSFNNLSVPLLEIFALGANAAQIVVLDVIKTS
jgi:hypothetical protein